MPDGSKDNPYRSPTEVQTPPTLQAVDSGKPLLLRGWVVFLFGFFLTFGGLLGTPVENYHPNIRPVSTVVSLGRYYQETFRELLFPSPNSRNGNNLKLFFSRFGVQVLVSAGGGLVGLAIRGILTRLGINIQIGTIPPPRR